MTKKTLNSKKTQKPKNRKIKRFKHRFYKKILKSKINTCKTSTTNETEKNKDNIYNKKENSMNIELIQENMAKYADKLLTNYLETYAQSIINELLLKESKEKKKVINETILNKYNLTKKHRKCALKFLFDLIQMHNINIKCYFSTVSIFDLFLINYSEDEDNNCETFFCSKKTNQFSETKLVLFVLCCFYLVSKYYNITKVLTVDAILEYENAKEEVNYDDLIELIDNIMIYIDANISNINLYYYIEVNMIDIKNMKELTNYPKFLEIFNKIVVYFGMRILQDLDLLNISENIQALAIILFSFEFSIFKSEEKSEILDRCLGKWKENIKNILINDKINEFGSIINWLNICVSNNNI